MTRKKSYKRRVRRRMDVTGQSYTAAAVDVAAGSFDLAESNRPHPLALNLDAACV